MEVAELLSFSCGPFVEKEPASSFRGRAAVVVVLALVPEDDHDEEEEEKRPFFA